MGIVRNNSHARLAVYAESVLKALGYKDSQICYEYELDFGRTDVAGFNDTTIAFECGLVSAEKLALLAKEFDEIVHLPMSFSRNINVLPAQKEQARLLIEQKQVAPEVTVNLEATGIESINVEEGLRKTGLVAHFTLSEVEWLRSTKHERTTKTVRIYQPYTKEAEKRGIGLTNLINVALHYYLAKRVV